MGRRAKVDLVEPLRRESEVGVGTIRGVAQTFGVHRQRVREAVVHAPPPARTERQRPKLDPAIPFIDAILAADRQAPHKQRHSGQRIFHRRQAELPTCRVAESTVREYAREPKRALGLLGRATGVPQSYAWRGEVQVDGYEAVPDVEGARQTLQGFGLRSTASGGAFHRAYPHATQQAFLEAHEAAFRYFGGVFHRLRSDNMPLAVKRIRRGRTRDQTTRVLACRSHWRFAAEFCSPAESLGPDPAGPRSCGAERAAPEGLRGRAAPDPGGPGAAHRRRDAAGGLPAAAARRRGVRPGGGELPPGRWLWVCQGVHECLLGPRPGGHPGGSQGSPTQVEVRHAGHSLAWHARCYGRQQQVLDLEHHLDVLEQKPGALAGATPLAQWRAQGRPSGAPVVVSQVTKSWWTTSGIPGGRPERAASCWRPGSRLAANRARQRPTHSRSVRRARALAAAVRPAAAWRTIRARLTSRRGIRRPRAQRSRMARSAAVRTIGRATWTGWVAIGGSLDSFGEGCHHIFDTILHGTSPCAWGSTGGSTGGSTVGCTPRAVWVCAVAGSLARAAQCGCHGPGHSANSFDSLTARPACLPEARAGTPRSRRGRGRDCRAAWVPSAIPEHQSRIY